MCELLLLGIAGADALKLKSVTVYKFGLFNLTYLKEAGLVVVQRLDTIVIYIFGKKVQVSTLFILTNKACLSAYLRHCSFEKIEGKLPYGIIYLTKDFKDFTNLINIKV